MTSGRNSLLDDASTGLDGGGPMVENFFCSQGYFIGEVPILGVSGVDRSSSVRSVGQNPQNDFMYSIKFDAGSKYHREHEVIRIWPGLQAVAEGTCIYTRDTSGGNNA
jgi:hypothetical protein